MKKSSFLIFFSVVFSVYGLVNLYIFMTGLHAVPSDFVLLYITLYLFLSLSYIIGRFLERRFLNAVSSLFVWIGSFWLAAMVYFLLFSVLLDILRIAAAIFGVELQTVYMDYGQLKLTVFIIIVAAVMVIVIAGFINARNPRIKKLDITIDKRAGNLEQLKIAVASDIHLGTIICRRRLEKIVKIINSMEADIVLLPGDVVDEDLGPVIKQNLGEVLRTIRSKYGVFAVTGNHEYIGGAEPAVKYLTEHGITELRDSYLKIADSFYVIGREDLSGKQFGGNWRKPLGEIMTGIDKNLPLIMMDHQPSKLAEAEREGIDLQLSGHTHHGQLWPFNFITKKIYEVSMGYKRKGKTHYYVSCGVGTWGPPVRTGNKPEIIEIALNFR